MYIDASSVRASDRKFESEVVRLIREALHPYERQLERVHVQVSFTPGAYVCRLHAWAERRQTVVIESSAASRLSAIQTAADSLKGAIARRAAQGFLAGALPRPPELATSSADASAEPAAASDAPAAGSANRSVMGRPRVLLALHDLESSDACLRWARVLTDALGADLDVCRVLPNLPAPGELPPGKLWLEATRRLLAATRETRLWCAAALPDAEFSERLIPGGDDVVRETALRARELGVDWIVLQHERACGPSATALARESGCPVLVARPPTSRSTLLVATDVCGDLYPLSRCTAALAEALYAPVLAFHDVGFCTDELSSRVDALTEAWAKVQAERMRHLGHQRLPELEVLLAHGSDPVQTILEQARREDAEIVIVGTGEGAALQGEDRLAASVVDHAIRSVLVVPSNSDAAREPQAVASDTGYDSTRSGPGSKRRRLPRPGSRTQPAGVQRRWRSG